MGRSHGADLDTDAALGTETCIYRHHIIDHTERYCGTQINTTTTPYTLLSSNNDHVNPPL